MLQAEAIGDLIAAETEIQMEQAQNIIKGKSFLKFNDLREKLIKVLSKIEAKIDFPEEDLPSNVLDDVKRNVSTIENEIKKGVLSLPTGAWFDTDEEGIEQQGNPNVLTFDKGTSRLGQGPSAHTTLVNIVKEK